MAGMFKSNDTVFSRSRAKEGVVLRETAPGWYEVFFSATERVRLPEGDLESASPVDRLLARLLNNDFDRPVDFDLHTMALTLQIAHHQDPYASLSNSRLEPQPHQVFVTHKAVSSGLYPRMLLADDVGLGKTIEAGMILKELKARGLVRRTLIIAPASLVTQWQRELLTKFNEKFTIFDSNRERIYQSDEPDRNIWETTDQVICTLPFARDDRRAEQLAAAGWDLVIFDEAHHVRRSYEGGGEMRARKAYQLAERLREQTKAMLLLTATPLQLQDFEFYSLLELLDPSVFPTYPDFSRYRQARADLNRVIGRVQEFHLLTAREQAATAQQVADRLPAAGTVETLINTMTTEAGREAVIDHLSQENKLSDLMIRNRKKVIGGFAKRRPKVLPVDMTPEERWVYESMKRYLKEGYSISQEKGDRALGFVMVIFQRLLTSSPYALIQALSRRIAKLQEEETVFEEIGDSVDDDVESDQELSDRYATVAGHRSDRNTSGEVHALEELRDLVKGLKVDTKLQKLDQMLAAPLSNSSQKVLIFTQFRETLSYLQHHLSKRYKVEVFHGGMSASEKDQATEAFRNYAQILIATEAGGEGRNFQFCNIMVNYDLPWNPMKIEQRIGRLDRIGQRRDVFIYNFSMTDTVEAKVLDLLQERVRIFEETIGGLDPILGDIEQDLTRLIMEHSGDFDREAQRIGVSLEDKMRRAREAEARMSDFLMDRASFRRDTYNEIQNRKPTYDHTDLLRFLEYFFQRYTPMKRRSDGTIEVEPPSIWRTRHKDLHEFVQIFGTCDPALAIRREDLEFFAFGNRLFDAVLGDCLAEQFPGKVTSRICPGTSEPGRRMLQCNVLIRFEGVRLFQRLVPICLDLDEGFYDEELSREIAYGLSDSKPGPPLDETLQALIQHAWEDINTYGAKVAGELLEDVQRENLSLYTREREKQERLLHYRRQKLEMELLRNQETLARITASESAEERRVLPIYRKKDSELREDLQELGQEGERALAEMDRRQYVTPGIEIHSAAFVITR